MLLLNHVKYQALYITCFFYTSPNKIIYEAKSVAFKISVIMFDETTFQSLSVCIGNVSIEKVFFINSFFILKLLNLLGSRDFFGRLEHKRSSFVLVVVAVCL